MKKLLQKFLFSFSVLVLLVNAKSFAQTPSWQWANGAGSTGTEMTTGTALDGSGNLFATGWYTSASITFGTNTFMNQGSFTGDIFLVKYNPSGTVLWAKSFGAADGELCNGVAADAAGNVYITGLFASPTLAIGSVTLVNSNPGSSDIFVAKLDATGNTVWVKSAGSTQADRGNGIAVDASGNVFATGYYISPVINFGTGNLTNAGTTTTDFFLTKYDNNGNTLWARSVGGTNNESGNSVAVDSLGNAYITGAFMSASINFGSGVINNSTAGSQDVFVVKYNGSGTAVWSARTGGSLDDFGNSIAVKKNNVYLTGGYNSAAITVSTNTLTNASAGTVDLFLIKMDLGGIVQWAKRSGGLDSEAGNGVATDSMGNVFVTGYFSSSSLTFGTITVNNFSFGYRDLFVAAYNSGGTANWATEVGSTYDETANCIAVHPGGTDIYIGGLFSSGVVSFGAYNVYKGCGDDVFVAKLLGPLVGIQEYVSNETVSAFPNPTSGKIFIREKGEITVYNSLGEIVLSENITEANEIDLSNQPKGVYYVKLSDSNLKTKTGKLIVE